jgi:uncharacterized membrane protein YcaP (DUF421 family)
MSIVLSAAAVFLLVWVVVRLVGKRELSEMAPFDFVILVVMGDLIAEGVIAEDTSLTGALIAVSTFGVLTVLVSWLSWRSPGHRGVFEGVPTLLIRNGEIVDEAMKIERLNLADLLAAARQQGIADLDDVRWAVLEQDGKFSFFADTQHE